MSAPATKSVIDWIHGVEVSDPFRWLEHRDSLDTEGWLNERRDEIRTYFAGISSMDHFREDIRRRLAREVIDQPAFGGGRYFYRRRGPNDSQASICFRGGAVDRVLVSPTRISPDHSVSIYRVSESGNVVAYEQRIGGDDCAEIHFVNTKTGDIYPDRIERGRFRGLEFCADDSGFFYSQESDGCAHQIRFHRFGETEGDEVLFTFPHESHSRLVLTGDGTRLAAIWLHLKADAVAIDVWLRNLTDDAGWRPVCEDRTYPFCPFLMEGQVFGIDYADDKDGKLLKLNDQGEWEPASTFCGDLPLRSFSYSQGMILTCAQDLAHSTITAYPLGGAQPRILLSSETGTYRLLPTLSHNGPLFVSFEGFDDPGSLYEVNPSTCQIQRWHRSLPTSAPAAISVLRTSCLAADGIAIPVTLVSPKAKPQGDGPVPCIMTGYGGFGISMRLRYSDFVNSMLKRGATFVIAHIRGGGEFGPDWHEAGRRLQKRQSFSDFVRVAEWLCEEGITTPRQLGIFGGSNSGLLVGAAMTQKPELFGAVLCIAPLLDMIRFERFNHAAQWASEYGTIKDPEDFRNLLSYSPYHRLSEGREYPAFLVVAGDRDERCNPAHARKFVARLLACTSRERPILLDHDPMRGHKAVLPLDVRVESVARRVAFFCCELGMESPEGTRV